MDEWSTENTQFSVILLQMIYPPWLSSTRVGLKNDSTNSEESESYPGTLDHLERSNTMNSRGGKRT